MRWLRAITCRTFASLKIKSNRPIKINLIARIEKKRECEMVITLNEAHDDGQWAESEGLARTKKPASLKQAEKSFRLKEWVDERPKKKAKIRRRRRGRRKLRRRRWSLTIASTCSIRMQSGQWTGQRRKKVKEDMVDKANACRCPVKWSCEWLDRRGTRSLNKVNHD